jgi:sulfopyruvate decarboxylase TPP-binding subunit
MQLSGNIMGRAETLDAEGSQDVRGRSLIAAMKACGFSIIVTLPDITTSDGVLRVLAQDEEMRLVRVCKEDEGIGIIAGMSYCNQRGMILMQSTGLFDSLNAIRALGGEYQLPICMMVGLLSKEPRVPPTKSELYSVRIVEPILDTMGIRHELVETEADVAKIKPAIDWAYANSKPVAILIGCSPRADA